jgi:hypothetical protein
MEPTAAQITEALKIINQVGVPTEKVIRDVAMVMAERDQLAIQLDNLEEEIKNS